MKYRMLLAACTLFICPVVRSQSEVLLMEVDSLKAQALAEGYSYLGGSWANTWSDPEEGTWWGIKFDRHTTYEAAANYIVLVLVEDCAACQVQFEWRDEEGQPTDTTLPEPVMEYSEGMGMGRLSLELEEDATGQVCCYVMGKKVHSTYAIMFSRATP